jgi:phage FluMu protein Com
MGTLRASAGGAAELRCTRCGALLGKLEEAGLSIRRGELQVTVDGTFRATLVCYRPRCRTLNIMRHSTEAPAALAAAS